MADGRDLFMPAHSQAGISAAFEQWVKKYGEEKARYLLEVMGEWTSHYTRGVLIDYEFTRPLNLREQVRQICADRGWEFAEEPGDLGMFQRLLAGDWKDQEVLILQPHEQVAATFDEAIIGPQPAPHCQAHKPAT